MLDKDNSISAMYQDFVCPICGEHEILDNAYIETRNTGGNVTRGSNGPFGLGGSKITVTTYSNYFRFCKKCGEKREHARKVARTIYMILLVIATIAITLVVYLKTNDWTIFLMPVIIVPALLIFYNPVHNFLCFFSKNIRNTPDFSNHINYGRAKNGNAIGKKYELWNFPSFIPEPIDDLDYNNNFKCPVCNKISDISEKGIYRCYVGKSVYHQNNAETEEKHYSNVRLCGDCHNEYTNKVKISKMAFLVSIVLLSILALVYLKLTNSETNVFGMAAILLIVGCAIYFSLRNLIVKFVLRFSKFNPSRKDYQTLKNSNAIDI